MIFAKSSAVKLIRMSVAHESLLTPVFKKVSSSMVRRRSTFTVTENLKFNSFDSIKFTGNRASIDKLRPLIVVLEYMNAKGKHIQKVADVYLDRGFDVLQVSLKPMQLLFPVKGSQVVAKDLADFLAVNQSFTPLVIHAFSVGAYLWGETIMHFSKDLKTYQPVIDRIKALIYDSPADIEALTTAFPASLFPNNAILRASFSSYIRYLLFTSQIKVSPFNILGHA
ncbi:UNVERIFIED_CONTAM: hypothetical protein PYX00_005800 [Menopon gallinae]|uniref:Uncharacterized protein n=1 Tax=Menopon gallinae TaxID=328185 RepID=A0AAW2HT15_9NEOP